MKIMLVRPDYAKNYASTIYSSLTKRVGNWNSPTSNGVGSPKRMGNWSPPIGYGIWSPPREWVTGALQLAME